MNESLLFKHGNFVRERERERQRQRERETETETERERDRERERELGRFEGKKKRLFADYLEWFQKRKEVASVSINSISELFF